MPRQHDPAFFLRVTTGPGQMRLRGANELATATTLAIGLTIARNVALHATLSGWSELGGNGGEEGFLGIGATSYAGPGLFGSASYGTTGDEGLLELQGGKEWWISNRWSLGAAVVYDGVHSESAHVRTFLGGQFVATFN